MKLWKWIRQNHAPAPPPAPKPPPKPRETFTPDRVGEVRFRLNKCALCHNQPDDGLEKVLPFGVHFSRCNACGFIQRATVRESSFVGQGPSAGVESGEREVFLAKLLREHFGLGGPILLYGTGYSPAFKALVDAGFDVYGCDITQALVDERAAIYGADRFFHADQLGGKQFDGIVAVEVIEHFVDPRSEATKLRAAMTERGIFCGTTNFVFNGEIECPAQYFRSGSHVAAFTEQSFAYFAERQGRRSALYRTFTPGCGFPGVLEGKFPAKRVFFSYPEAHAEKFAAFEGYSHFPIVAP